MKTKTAILLLVLVFISSCRNYSACLNGKAMSKPMVSGHKRAVYNPQY